jgi:hypothetical protein
MEDTDTDIGTGIDMDTDIGTGIDMDTDERGGNVVRYPYHLVAT